MRERGNINGGDGVRVLSDVLSDPVVGATHPSFYRLKGGGGQIYGVVEMREMVNIQRKKEREKG